MPPKKKQEKMSLGTFLQDENYGSWADEMEDMPLPVSDSRPSYGGDRRTAQSAGFGMGMGNGFSDRRDTFTPREQLPLPTQPPFTAHLANLSFDATNADIEQFFQDCSVTNVRIVEDKLDRKPKGFGYVEFATQDGLKTALTLSGSSLAGRQVRISVAEPPKERQDARDLSDWSRKGPLPDLAGSQRRVSDRPPFGSRNFDNLSDAGSERGGRRGYESGDGKMRDFSNWERKGPLPPAAGPGPSLRDGGRQRSKDGPGFRRNSPAWGEGRSQDGSRPPRREYTERPIVERPPMASELDTEWRARMKPDRPTQSPTPETSNTPETTNPPSPKPVAAPTTRPKLNLAKRTVSEANPDSSTAAGDSKASPFGAARPVDTAAKEREIEEKRQLALRQKKDAEDKDKAQRTEEKKSTKDKPDQEKGPSSSPRHLKERSASKENGDEQAQPPKYDILRRVDPATHDMVVGDDDTEERPRAAEKDSKPKEVAADTPTQSNGSWRNGSAQKKSAPAAEATEEDGWSTVSKHNKQRNNRRHNASRALAS
ncbi:hypothetical protein DV736_g4851, partial [Chaetothyriales sp. CBS 134916]